MEQLVESIRAAVAEGATAEQKAAGAQACRTILTALEVEPGKAIVVANAPTPSPLAGMSGEQAMDLLIARLSALVPSEKAERKPGYRLTVNLENQTIYDSEGFEDAFEIEPFIRERLLRGLDDIAMTLQEEDEIAAFEATRPSWLEPAKS